MIFYGTNGKLIRTEALPGVPCPACATPDALQMSVFSRYAHIYWIPFFPFQKKVVVQCGHCQRLWEDKGIPAELQAAAQALKKQSSFPLWQWAGTAILVVGIIIAVVASGANKRNNAAYLKAPQVGDIYTVRSDKNYTLMKVIGVRGSSVEMLPNDYELDHRHPLDELNMPEKYGKEPVVMSTFELQSMATQDKLVDVDRLGQ